MRRYSTGFVVVLALSALLGLPALAEEADPNELPDYSARYAFDYEDTRSEGFDPTPADLQQDGPQPAIIMEDSSASATDFLVRGEPLEAPELPLD